ncbi:glycerol-3-phosphate acyltransferase PlsY [Stella humosa]|uniref:Glycerol-3-phosphate acyltransferase n=1 Tax=Stella humosa TaxID=94 RepID=A0A3N1KLB0_9PROT|nr:glycerol-3-phosphate 1-O-acyltransferase PlsY [Stella humosa]ROP81184.1 glycerol-3-phosphate acyltransferase PlsY [Stella humosa]BBK32530.1 glycerol-3-phosphate acyltransferase [Stella humosa]
MSATMVAILAGLGGLLLGSIPFGLLLTRAAGLGDIRAIGSGNIGATNVLRTGRKDLAIATLLLDGGKGALAVILAAPFGPTAAALAAGGAVLGHMFTPWLAFQGGKGMATAIGVSLAMAWPLGLGLILVWLLMAAIFRISSLAALTACVAAPVISWLLADFPGLAPHPERTLLIAIVGVLVILRHPDNIRRLLAGTEPRIGRSNKG